MLSDGDDTVEHIYNEEPIWLWDLYQPSYPFLKQLWSVDTDYMIPYIVINDAPCNQTTNPTVAALYQIFILCC